MPDFDTTFAFTAGKLTVVLDGGAGSSGKGKLRAFLCEHAQNWHFALGRAIGPATSCLEP